MAESPCAPDVYFPVEIPAREYAGHMLMAVELASRGLTSIIGGKGRTARLMAESSRKGLAFYKHGRQLQWTDDYHSIVGQDPEAGISWLRFADFAQGTETTLGRKIMYRSPRHLAQFCFGPDDHDYLREEHPEEAEKIHLSGSPRVSLWGAAGAHFYRTQTEQIAERFGRPVIFASSGGFEHEQYLDLRGADHRSAWAEASGAIGLLAAARAVARESDVHVVIRPHPGESSAAWLEATADEPRITVSSALDLAAWVRASVALVHAGTSTAAVEAVCAGTPAISADTDDGRYFVSPQISHRAASTEHVAELVTAASRGQLPCLPDDAAQTLLEWKLLHPLDGATQRIADVILDVVPFSGSSAIRRRRQLRQRFRRRLTLRDASPNTLQHGVAARFKGELPSAEQVECDSESAARILGHSTTPLILALEEGLYLIRPSN